MQTNIYHITYTPAQRDVCVHFWGCNFQCRGCYCKQQIYSPMLDFGAVLKGDSVSSVAQPQRFLSLAEVEAVLSELEFDSVVMEGQEASLDPAYSLFTEMLHERFNAKVTLVTNAMELPDLAHTDTIEVGIKALDDNLHRDFTGVSNQQTLKNLDKLIAMHKNVVIDTVLIPDYIDASEIESIAKYIAARDPNIPFILLPYFQVGDNHWRRPTIEEMDNTADLVKKHIKRVFHFRGDEELNHPLYNVFPIDAQPLTSKEPEGVKWLTRINGLNPRPKLRFPEIVNNEERFLS
ncbi:MAG: radical SAM protein [Dehalogenimonas sp.]